MRRWAGSMPVDGFCEFGNWLQGSFYITFFRFFPTLHLDNISFYIFCIRKSSCAQCTVFSTNYFSYKFATFSQQ